MLERCQRAGIRQPEFRLDSGFFILTIWRKIFEMPVVQQKYELESRLESLLAAKILIILKDGEQGKSGLASELVSRQLSSVDYWNNDSIKYFQNTVI